MGFAVIPIIFTIAEDSLANVPQHLRAGSLALGATRWQTALRIVLPTASPGIFSAIMIGFGRAVGETMIVLMATGNTPVMDWSIFNGFRALSANIAVELPEAPEGGTLFRVLFLAAFLLFCLTFARQHRRRAGAAQAPAEVPVPMSDARSVLAQRRAVHLAHRRGAGALAPAGGRAHRRSSSTTASGFFWPRTSLRADPRATARSLTGQVVEREPIPGKPGQYRIKLKVANRDLYGADFQWVDESQIATRDVPGRRRR